MTIKAHLAELERQHKALEDEITEALAHSSSDNLKITELKRRKLLLKEEIERVRHDHSLFKRSTSAVIPTLELRVSRKIEATNEPRQTKRMAAQAR